MLEMVVGHPEKLQKRNLISQDTDSQLIRGNAARIMIYLPLSGHLPAEILHAFDKVKPFYPMVSGKKVSRERNNHLAYCQKLFSYFLQQRKARKLSRTLMPNHTTF